MRISTNFTSLLNQIDLNFRWHFNVQLLKPPIGTNVLEFNLEVLLRIHLQCGLHFNVQLSKPPIGINFLKFYSFEMFQVHFNVVCAPTLNFKTPRLGLVSSNII